MTDPTATSPVICQTSTITTQTCILNLHSIKTAKLILFHSLPNVGANPVQSVKLIVCRRQCLHGARGAGGRRAVGARAGRRAGCRAGAAALGAAATAASALPECCGCCEWI